MANIIDLSGDRCLQFSGSEAFYRKMDIPSGSTDIRFGMMISTPVSASGANYIPQQISPANSVFEKSVLAFMSQTGSIPFGTGSNYFGVWNIADGSGDISQLRDVDGAGEFFIMANNARLSFQVLVQNPNWSQPTEYYNNQGKSFGVNSIPTLSQPCLNVFRIYKFGADEISYTIYIKRVTSTNPETVELILRDGLTNVDSLTLTNTRGRVQYANPSLRDQAFDTLNTIFFGWPFYNEQLNVHCIGYRAI